MLWDSLAVGLDYQVLLMGTETVGGRERHLPVACVTLQHLLVLQAHLAALDDGCKVPPLCCFPSHGKLVHLSPVFGFFG